MTDKQKKAFATLIRLALRAVEGDGSWISPPLGEEMDNLWAVLEDLEPS